MTRRESYTDFVQIQNVLNRLNDSVTNISNSVFSLSEQNTMRSHDFRELRQNMQQYSQNVNNLGTNNQNTINSSLQN